MVDISNFDLTCTIPAEIAVITSDGLIVRHNQKWDETARIGLLAPKPEGWNYIAECEAAVERSNADAPRIFAGLRRVLTGETPTFISTYVCPFNGLHHWYQIVVSTFTVEGERHAVILHVDVSALQRDALTGLANRAMFEAQLALNLELARESGQRTGVIFADINHLKMINDQYGHLTGDAALKALGEALRQLVTPDSVVTRLGGDEFGVVMPVSYELPMGPRLRLALRTGINCTIQTEHGSLTVSASVGVAFYPADGANQRELMTSADQSMYAQKRAVSNA